VTGAIVSIETQPPAGGNAALLPSTRDLRCPVCAVKSPCRGLERWEGYTLRHCPACDVIFADPMIPAGAGFYQRPGDHGCECLDAIYVDRKTTHQGWEGVSHNGRLFLRTRPAAGGRLLDAGCGSGLFLHYAKRHYEVTGIDIDGEAITAAREMYGISDVHSLSLKEFGAAFRDRRFDVITMFEVLEHLDDPIGHVEVLKSLLAPGGVLVVSVPNRERKSFNEDKFGIADYPPNHMTRWNATALRNFITRQGFEIITLYSRRSDWYGFFESEDILGYRLKSLIAPLIRRLQRKRAVGLDHGRSRVVCEDTPASRALKLGLKRISSLLWFPLWLPLRISKRPSYGLWLMAARKGQVQ